VVVIGRRSKWVGLVTAGNGRIGSDSWMGGAGKTDGWVGGADRTDG